MNKKKKKKIVDGAPKLSDYYCASAEMYHSCDDLGHYDCCINLQDLRTELAKREPMELRAVDIPHRTIVLEK